MKKLPNPKLSSPVTEVVKSKHSNQDHEDVQSCDQRVGSSNRDNLMTNCKQREACENIQQTDMEIGNSEFSKQNTRIISIAGLKLETKSDLKSDSATVICNCEENVIREGYDCAKEHSEKTNQKVPGSSISKGSLVQIEEINNKGEYLKIRSKFHGN